MKSEEAKETGFSPLKLFIGLTIARQQNGQSHIQPTAVIAPSVEVARNQGVEQMKAAFPDCACETDAFSEMPEHLLGILVPPRASEWLLRHVRYGGAIVSSSMLTVEEIELARANNHFWVDEEGFGYAYVPPLVNISPVETKDGGGPDVPLTLPAGPTEKEIKDGVGYGG